MRLGKKNGYTSKKKNQNHKMDELEVRKNIQSNNNDSGFQ